MAGRLDTMTELALGAHSAHRTALVERHYDRIASSYDTLMAPIELAARSWRRDQWRTIERGEHVLEIGVGTGRSVPFYPPAANVSAIDISSRMLERAKHRAARLGVHADFRVADVQRLPFADASFDAVVATLVFCSVPDPALGLREIRRVLRPGGRLSLVEHVVSGRWWLRPLMEAVDWVTAARWGEHFARDTVAEVVTAGFSRIESRDLALDVVKAIRAER